MPAKKKQEIFSCGVFVGDFLKKTRGFCGGLFEKSPPHPPKTPQTKGIATLGRKGEHGASFFYAAKGSFRVPLLQYRLWFVPLPPVDFFEASPYGVLADGGGGVITHEVHITSEGHITRAAHITSEGHITHEVHITRRRRTLSLLYSVIPLQNSRRGERCIFSRIALLQYHRNHDLGGVKRRRANE